MRAFQGLIAATVLLFGGCDRAPPPPVRIASVAEAPQHHEAKRIEFSGVARPDLAGMTTWKTTASSSRGPAGPSIEHHMHVVPIVPPGWSADQPVPLWVTGPGELGESPQAWKDSLAALETSFFTGSVADYAGREPGFRTTSGWQRAIADAEQKHGIRSDPHAPVVMWPEPD